MDFNYALSGCSAMEAQTNFGTNIKQNQPCFKAVYTALAEQQ